ncbi:heme NO-binding domain-containing protein [Neogemmobacter tilapiae]|uniref:Heme NO-binding domain-containing protein n=1 Tax=Neogemmobacter tilapiae TaxID=875041 RepID=A0A918TS98_9RHOB|nr:heme NO-binding domain-containing protein [Gemmobacter tilapiae]GHC54560.1 hypothetical protein GCM10007315_16860 [Gemmobacter tilapiae]
MHGLVNKAFQSFVRDTFGVAAWISIARHAELGFEGFESLTHYDPTLTGRVVDAMVVVLNRPRETLFEDMGNYLICHPNCQALRRLLRFGGAGFVDFLFSLDELPERARLALADLDLPQMVLTQMGDDHFVVRVQGALPGCAYVLVGLLRALADDYGTLAVIEHHGDGQGGEVVGVRVLEQGFAEGRHFDLATAGALS